MMLFAGFYSLFTDEQLVALKISFVQSVSVPMIKKPALVFNLRFLRFCCSYDAYLTLPSSNTLVPLSPTFRSYLIPICKTAQSLASGLGS